MQSCILYLVQGLALDKQRNSVTNPTQRNSERKPEIRQWKK